MRRALICIALALLVLAPATPPVSAQDHVPGSAIRDRIKDRIERRRIERAPAIAGSAKAAGIKAGYQAITIGGQTRSFLRYTPNAVLLSGKRAPVVFALHGAKGTADRLQGYLGLNALADRDGFIVVYPQGENNRWNDGRTEEETGGRDVSNADDTGFLNGLADALVAQGVADSKRLYVMGISNGGFMAMRLACSGQSRFEGFGAVIASMPLEAKAGCAPAKPLKLVMINGTKDLLIRYDGDEGKYGIKGNFAPADLAGFMAAKAQCSRSSEQALPDIDPKDDTTVVKRTWAGCAAGSGVELYTVKGGGHQPPSTGKAGVAGMLLEVFLGTRSRDIDTAETVWGFFKR